MFSHSHHVKSDAHDGPPRAWVGWHIVPILLAGTLFLADLLMPRGPAPAIGYCAVVVLAGESRRTGFMFIITILCTLLTWLGYHYEPDGVPSWMSALNRGGVMGVIWLTAFLAYLRQRTRAILEQRTAELALSNRELDHFATAVSHDLRTPLMSIIGWAQILMKKLADHPNSEILTSLEKIIASARRMSAMVSRILEYARVGQSLNIVPCDTGRLVDQAIEDLKATVEKEQARIGRNSLPEVGADETLLAQVFQNLLENALKYRREEPPRIHVSAEHDVDRWIFSVQDNGMGIAAQHFERIFELFERVEQSQGNQAGTGVGLATCRKIIDRHGGKMWVESQVGVGSIFRFTIPAHPAR